MSNTVSETAFINLNVFNQDLECFAYKKAKL